VFGVSGACRTCELPLVTLRDIERQGDVYLVKIPKTKNNEARSFTICGWFVNVVQKYAGMRPRHAKHDKFFLEFFNAENAPCRTLARTNFMECLDVLPHTCS